jgi:hypothetical protein
LKLCTSLTEAVGPEDRGEIIFRNTPKPYERPKPAPPPDESLEGEEHE